MLFVALGTVWRRRGEAKGAPRDCLREVCQPGQPTRWSTTPTRAEAMEHPDFAVGEFRDMKMQPSLERALSHRDFLKAKVYGN